MYDAAYFFGNEYVGLKGLGFRVSGSRFRVQNLGFWVYGKALPVLWAWSLGCRVLGFGFRTSV